jgi:hypothetical protein
MIIWRYLSRCREIFTEFWSKALNGLVDKYLAMNVIRDQPFNLKGGGYGFLFHSEMFFRTTQELEYLYFLSREAQIFFPQFNIRLYDKKSESDFFFISTKIIIFFSATLGIRLFFLEKNHNPHPPSSYMVVPLY